MTKMAPVLSREQNKATEIYHASYLGATMVASVLLFVAWMAVMVFLHWVTPKLGLGAFKIINPTSGLVPASLVIGQNWAKRRVRQAGVSQEAETVEVVPNTAPTFSGDPIEWKSQQTKATNVALASIVLMGSVFLGGAWYYLDIGWFAELVCAVAFVFLLGVAFKLLWNPPFSLAFDAEGIVVSKSRRVFWKDIATCEVRQRRDLLGIHTWCWIVFKSGQDKILLKLSPQSLASLAKRRPANPFEEIEAEIKHRLTGTPTD